MRNNTSYILPQPTKILVVLLIIFLAPISSYAATKTWNKTVGGPWSTAANWTPSGVPAVGDDVIIGAQSAAITDVPARVLNSLTINGDVTLASSRARTLTIGGKSGLDFTIASNATLTLGSTVSITLANNATAEILGNLIVNSGSTFNTNGTAVVTTVTGSIVNYGTVTCTSATKLLFQNGSTYNMASNSGTIPTSTWDDNSTCLITGYTSATGNPTGYATSFNQSFGNFTWNCTGQSSSSHITVGATLTTINGDFRMLSTGAGSFSFGNTGTGSIDIAGNYIQSGGILYCSGYGGSATNSGAARNINIAGYFSLTGGTFDLSYSNITANVVTLNVGGDFTHTGGTLTERGSTTGSNITFTGLKSPQIYTSGGTISNTVNFVVGSSSNLQMGTAASPAIIAGSNGSFTLESGATLGVTSPAGISATGTNTGNIQVTGVRSYSSGDINYMGNGAQATGNGLTAAANVSITNTAGLVTFTSKAIIDGNISMVSGSTANLNGQIHPAGSLTLGGAIQAGLNTYGGSSSVASVKNSTFFPNSQTGVISLGSCVAGTWIGMTSRDWHTASNWCDNKIPISSDNIIITAGTNQPLISATAVCGNITINPGATVTLSGSNSLTVSGSFDNNGSFVTNAGTLTVNGDYTNKGSFNGNSGTLVIKNNSATAFTNNGTFTANTGTVNFNGGAQTAVTPAQTLFYNVIISGTGVKTITPANFVVTGTLSMESAATISSLPTYGAQAALQYNTSTARNVGVEWPATFSPARGVIIKNTGIITLNANKVFSNSPLTVFDGATLSLSTFSLSGPNAINLKCGAASAGSAITGTGTLTLGGSVNVTKVTVVGTTGTVGASISCPVSLSATTYEFNVANDGTAASDLTLSGVVSGAGSISKSGVGTLTLTHAGNTFTGSTIASEGEVRMNPASTTTTFKSQVELDGGDFSTTNITTNTILTSSSTLLLSDNSSIILGSNVHSLKFADSRSIPWEPAKYLKIIGWKGNYSAPSSGTAGKIFVGTSAAGLTADQLAEIKFYDGAAYFNATQLSSGEVVPSGPISVSFVSVQTGVWDDPETWGFTGNAVQGFTVPGGSDNATISANHVITLTATSKKETTGTLTFVENGTLAMGEFSMSVGLLLANSTTGTAKITSTKTGGSSIFVDQNAITKEGGVLDIENNQLLGLANGTTPPGTAGTIKTSNTSTAPIPTGKTWTSAIEYYAPTGGQTVMTGTYKNLTLSNTSGTQTANGTISVDGKLTTTAGGTLNMGTHQMLGALTSIVSNGIIQTQNTSTTPIPTGKTWGGVVNYNAATGAQTVMEGTYATLIMGNTSGTQTTSGNLATTTVNNSNAASILNLGTNTLTATTINNTGTIRTQNVSAAPISGGLNIGGTVNYDAMTGGQTIVAQTSYSTLTMGNVSGTQTAAGNLVVTALNNNTNAAAILDLSTYALSAATINNTGTIRTQNTSSTPISGGLTIGGTVRYDAATGGQTVVVQTSYSTLTLGNTSGEQTASGNIKASTLNTSVGGTFNMGTYALSGVTSTSHLGVLRTQNNSTTPFPGGLTWGGTIVFDGANAQTLPSNASIFNNLTISNTAGITAAANQTVNGILNLSVANPSATVGSLAMGTYILTLGTAEKTTGIGDVTGVISRSTYTTNTSYTFGNAKQIIIFPVVAGQTLPTNITVSISLTTTGPTWATKSIKRLYQMAQTGGSGTKAIFQCNYLDSELASGTDESILSYWSSPNNTTPSKEMGRSNNNTSANWVTLSDVDMSNMPTSLGGFYITLAPAGNIITWNGGTSTDWNTTTNWTPVGVPLTTQLIVIPNVTTTSNRSPILPAGAVGKAIIIANGGVVDAISGSKLTLSGIGAAWTTELGGTFNAGANSEVVLSGAGDEVSVAGSTTFNNLTISAETKLRPAEDSYTGITGALINNGTLAVATTENTFEFKQDGDYIIPNPNGSLPGYHNLIISGTGTKTLPTPLDIYGDFINNGTIATGTGTVNMKALDGFPHKIGGTTSPTAFYNLTIANTLSEIEIATAVDITVSNVLNVETNATLTPGAAFTVGGAGTLSGNGTVKVTRITSTPDFVTQYPIATKTLTGLTVDYAGAGTQTVNALNYNNLVISANVNRNVTLTSSGTIGVSNVFSPDLSSTTYTITGSTMEANGTGAQTIPEFNFYNIILSGDRGGASITLVNGGTIGIAGDGTVTAKNANIIGTNNTVNVNGENQNVAVFAYNNVIFSNSGTKTITGNQYVAGSLTVTSGVTVDMGTHILTGSSISNSGTIKTAVPTTISATPLPSALNWGGTVEYYGTSPQTVVAGTYNNLTMSGTGTGGGTTAGDITVNGVLNLAANTSTTQGILHTGNYILNLGISSTTTGLGDVTGIVSRNHVFTGLTDYSFGNQFTTLNFLNTGTKPTWVQCKISIGTAPTWRNSAINRIYSFAQSGGNDRMIVKLHYLDNELNGNTEDLVYWDAYDPALTQNNFVKHYPRSFNVRNADNNWIQLTGPAINYLATSDLLDVKQWSLSSIDVANHIHTWTGNGSPSYDGDWSLPGNWDGGVPDAHCHVVIPNPTKLPDDNNGDKAPYQNLLSAYAPSTCASIKIEEGAKMTMQDGSPIIITGAGDAWLNNGTFIGGTSAVTFSYGNVDKTVKIAGIGTSNFNDLTITANTNVRLGDASFIGISGTVTNNGVLDCSTHANTVNYNGAAQTVINPMNDAYSTLILSGTGVKTLPASTLNIHGSFIANAEINANTGTIVMDGVGAQTIGGTISPIFNNLTIATSGSTPTVKSEIDLTIAGALNLGSPSLSPNLQMDHHSLVVDGAYVPYGNLLTAADVDFNGTTACGGLLNATAGSVKYGELATNIQAGTYSGLSIEGSSVSFCGDVTVNAEFSALGTLNLVNDLILHGHVHCGGIMNASAGTVKYDALLGGQSILAGTYFNLLDNEAPATGDNIVTICGALTVNGKFSISGILNLTNDLTLNGAVDCRGIMNASAGTVKYTAPNGGQSIMTGSYYNFLNGNSSGSNLSCGDLDVNGETFTTTPGSKLDMGAYLFSATNNLMTVASSGTINTKNTSEAPIPSGKIWGGTLVLEGVAAQTLVNGKFANVTIDNAAGVSVADSAEINETLTINSEKKLIVGANKKLIANQITNNGGIAGLTIKADIPTIPGGTTLPNGTLIFNNAENSPVKATVEMYSKATWDLSQDTQNKYKWQYFGIPVKDIRASNTFDGAYIRKFNEAGTGTTNADLSKRHWIQLANNDVLTKVDGYEIVQAAPSIYFIEGELVNSNISKTLSYTSGAEYPGQHLFGNSYTAAIDISKITFSENMEKTVYLYNTGSYKEWSDNSDANKLGNEAGQYTAATLETAGEAGIPNRIPSMQGFLVRTNNNAGSIDINYAATVIRNTTSQRAPKAPMTWMRLSMQGAKANGDVMWLFSNEGTTRGNDNGWDGKKMFGPDGTPMLYSKNETGAYQINVQPNIHETDIVFRPGTLDTEYTITFNNENMEKEYQNVYFLDKELGRIVNVTQNGTKYSFIATGTSATERFKILTSDIADKNSETKINIFSNNGLLLVHNPLDHAIRVLIYDAIGRRIAQYECNAGELKSYNTNFIPGAYVVRTAGDELQGRVMIIHK